MDTLQEPGHPPVTKIKWKHPEGSSQEETKGTVAIKTEDTEVCITEMEMRHQPRCPSPMCMSESTSHEEQNNEASLEMLPGNQGHMVEFVGLLNGEKVYKLPTSNSTCTYDVPRLKNNQPRKRNKVQEQLEKHRPYIKKPLNAFMVFMREQRPHIDEEVKRKGNGVVNMHLAQKWKMMTKEQQAIYYQEAERQRQLHKQLFPEWSNGDNYVGAHCSTKRTWGD
ncbi:Transcription factor 7-like 1-C HMG box transcription factor 3-C [Takifugu flavidus]|uniref:Transcription factor 7-like 1-C HMG box transcription factor 3-C n=1 Tax=Takifugu flavidus TaxID=433684 RepID=A0A5C6MMX4_9TELE|nr:Transcription factor 7-like 1-C HMG box transcription factor 3-C [Takifugu flavidus]